MLKKRIIASIIVKDGTVVQSINFKKYLPIGNPEIAVEFLNRWGIDEIILVNIDTTKNKNKPDFEMLKKMSKKSLVPLTFGGGINSIEDVKTAIYNGADKVCLNNAALVNPNLITEAAEIFGNQSVVVSIDVRKNERGDYEVYSYLLEKEVGLNPVDFAKKVELLGAGEIFLNSVDRDGTKKGLDLKLLNQVAENVSIPVIFCGGIGHPEHFEEGFRNNKVNAIAAANYFHYTEHSVITTKAYLKLKGLNIRCDTYADYEKILFSEEGRIAKRAEEYLKEIRFEYFPEEKI